MQTFLPFPDFATSSAVLDTKRLGKQRVETFQILRALTWPSYAWKNHPAVRMWRGFIPALVAYGLANCAEWTARGCGDTDRDSLLAFSAGRERTQQELADAGELPPWLHSAALHLSHRSALLRKEPEWYRPIFGELPDDLPYWWPPALFPRWPLRPPVGGVELSAAPTLLGLEELRPEQQAAVRAVYAGSDATARFAPGCGATTTGLVAGLLIGPTLWVVPPMEPLTEDALDLPARPVAPPRTGRVSGAGSTARPPGPAELAAMAAEAEPAYWRFLHPADVSPTTLGKPALIVVDHAEQLSRAHRRRLHAARDGVGAPILSLRIR
jgi:hypothetical protein